MKRKALEQAAEELNFFLRLDPAINVRMPATELEAKIIEAASLLEPGEEELSLSLDADLEPEALEAQKEKVTAIQNTLKELGVSLFVDTKTEIKSNKREKTKVTETQTEVQGNAALLEMIQETKKLADLKVIVNEEDEFVPLRESLGDFKGLNGPQQLRKRMKEMLSNSPDSPSTSKETKSKKTGGGTKRKCTRSAAVGEVVKNLSGKNVTTTVEKLVELSDEIYEKNGGKTNFKEAQYIVRNILPFALTLGIITIDGDLLQIK